MVAAQPLSFHAVTTSPYSSPIELFYLSEYSSTDPFLKYIAFTALCDLVHEGWNDPGAILLPSPGSAARCPASSLPAPATALGHPAHPRSKPAAISSAKSLLRRDAEKSGGCQRRRAGMPRGSLAERSGLSHPIWSPPSVADFCFSAVTDKSPVWTWCRWKHGRGHSRFGNTTRRGTIDILLWSAPFLGALLSNFLAPLGTFTLFH